MNKVFEDYLSKVCGQVQDENARELVYKELAGHLDSFYRQTLAEGKSLAEANWGPATPPPCEYTDYCASEVRRTGGIQQL